jgi:hypothetical protein
VIPRAASALLFFAAVVAAGCERSHEASPPPLPPGWKELRDARLGIRIAMPDGIDANAGAAADAPLEHGVPYRYTSRDSDGTWYVTCVRAGRATSREGELLAMRSTYVGSVRTPVKAERGFLVQGLPASELIHVDDGFEWRTWIVAGPISVCLLGAPVNGTPADRAFFASFRWIDR